jgi:hypothetical protein
VYPKDLLISLFYEKYAVWMFKTKLAGRNCFAMLLLVGPPALCQTKPPSEAKAVPRLEEAVLPHYPAIAEAAHITGRLVVIVRVQSGRVVKAEAQGTSQDASPAIIRYLQPATLLNIQTWRFRSDVNDTFSVTYT